jgi:hypothetical protein
VYILNTLNVLDFSGIIMQENRAKGSKVFEGLQDPQKSTNRSLSRSRQKFDFGDDVCADLDNFRAKDVCVTIRTIVCPSQRSVSASRKLWWRSRQEIWMWLAAYGYHSKVY